MTETWFEIVVSCNGGKKRCLTATGKILSRLREAGYGIRNWHYFLDEPWGTLTLRIDSTASHEWMREASAEVFEADFGTEFVHYTAYRPEVDRYGDAWPHVAAFHTAAAEIGLMMANGYTAPKAIFKPSKLVHCTLNQWGYDWQAEVHFFESQAIGRQSMIDRNAREADDRKNRDQFDAATDRAERGRWT